MAKVYRLSLGIITALALCKCSLAEGNGTHGSANGTASDCHRHGNGDNCTDAIDTGQEHGHFSKCPEELTNYCVHGECRYVKDQKAPSCRCQHGYIGPRCEYLDLDWRIGEKRSVIIACVVAGLVVLILLIVFVCICSRHRCRLCCRRERRREEARNGTEKFGMTDANPAQGPLMADSPEPSHTNTEKSV
uniref:probetacellulin n=1 Tax=Scatophagus argus TaxID=75038 RepID=UPI001ED82C0D|nr:probetacellulin [Scatophagus argus]